MVVNIFLCNSTTGMATLEMFKKIFWVSADPWVIFAIYSYLTLIS